MFMYSPWVGYESPLPTAFMSVFTQKLSPVIIDVHVCMTVHVSIFWVEWGTVR